MRRFVFGVAAAFVAIGGSATVAGAFDEYCDWDPPVAILTPAGNLVTVHDSVWTAGLLQIGVPVTSYSVSRAYDRAGNPVTAVDMVVTVPAGLLSNFRTQDYVATGPLLSGTVLASAAGTSGSPTHLRFNLSTP